RHVRALSLDVFGVFHRLGGVCCKKYGRYALSGFLLSPRGPATINPADLGYEKLTFTPLVYLHGYGLNFAYLRRLDTFENSREYQLDLVTKRCKKNHGVPHYEWGL